MFMILAHHFAFHNTFAYSALPAGIYRFFIQFFLISAGKIGVVIFFTISAWFFLEHDQTLNSCMRRIWFLEKEVFFYSILLMVLYFIFDKPDMNIALVIKSLLPLIYGVWWYPTSYAVFLLFLPFLEQGLKALGKRNHLILAVVSLGLYGVIGLLPKTAIAEESGFFYLFILISAYRWYVEGKHKLNSWTMISIGTAIILLFTSLSIAAKAFRNIQVNSTDVVTGLNKLPALPIGFGVFLLFIRTEFHSGIINGMAKGAFAVYLITDYPASEHLWNGPFDLYMISMHPIQLLWVFGALIVIYLVCTVFDLIRQALFSVTIDRFWNRWFDAVWSHAARLGNMLVTKVE